MNVDNPCLERTARADRQYNGTSYEIRTVSLLLLAGDYRSYLRERMCSGRGFQNIDTAMLFKKLRTQSYVWKCEMTPDAIQCLLN